MCLAVESWTIHEQMNYAQARFSLDGRRKDVFASASFSTAQSVGGRTEVVFLFSVGTETSDNSRKIHHRVDWQSVFTYSLQKEEPRECWHKKRHPRSRESVCVCTHARVRACKPCKIKLIKLYQSWKSQNERAPMPRRAIDSRHAQRH